VKNTEENIEIKARGREEREYCKELSTKIVYQAACLKNNKF
jgi:hypothetical protein